MHVIDCFIFKSMCSALHCMDEEGECLTNNIPAADGTACVTEDSTEGVGLQKYTCKHINLSMALFNIFCYISWFSIYIYLHDWVLPCHDLIVSMVFFIKPFNCSGASRVIVWTRAIRWSPSTASGESGLLGRSAPGRVAEASRPVRGTAPIQGHQMVVYLKCLVNLFFVTFDTYFLNIPFDGKVYIDNKLVLLMCILQLMGLYYFFPINTFIFRFPFEI